MKACSQTCQSLLPLCRSHIYGTISLNGRDLPAVQRLRIIKSLKLLLDINPNIAHYVRNLVYEIDFKGDEDVNVGVLEKLHPVQTLELHGCGAYWNKLGSPMQKALLRLFHSHSLTRVRISFFWDFPVTAFIPCNTLTQLELDTLRFTAAAECDNNKEPTTLDPVPHIQSFAFGSADDFAMKVFHAKRSTGVPMLDFSNLKVLNIHASPRCGFEGRKTLLQASEKIEILHYQGMHSRNSFTWVLMFMLLPSASRDRYGRWMQRSGCLDEQNLFVNVERFTLCWESDQVSKTRCAVFARSSLNGRDST